MKFDYILRKFIQGESSIEDDSITVIDGAVILDTYKKIYKSAVATDTTYTFNVSALNKDIITFELYIDMTTVSTITFPASASWIDEPLMSVIGVYLLTFRTIDGGVTWRGNLADEVLS